MVAGERHIHFATELTAAVSVAAAAESSLPASVWVRLQKPWRGAMPLCCFPRQDALCWGKAYLSSSL